MTTDADRRDEEAPLVPTSGHLDANEAPRLPTVTEIREAILRGKPEDGPLQLTISNIGFFDQLDLSFETVHTRIIFRNCALNGGLLLTRATLPGLELYNVAVPLIDLDWARVDGDVRLVGVRPPQSRTVPESRDDEKPPVQPELVDYTTIRSAGTVVTGDVSLPGSRVRVDEADALLARRRPAPGAGAGVFTWERLFQAVGLGSALVAWVAVVGGATLWARMESIDAPALPTLATLGQSWMVTAGLQTLLVPMLLGASVALLIYFSRSDPNPTSPPDDSAVHAGSRPKKKDEEKRKTEKEHKEQKEGQGTAAPAVPAPSEPFQLRRARPLVALRRLRRTRRIAWLAVAVIGAMLAAALYVAQASWEVLVTTLLIVVVAIAAVGPVTGDGESEPSTKHAERHQEPGHEAGEPGQGSRAGPWFRAGRWFLVALCAGVPAFLVWWLMGGAPLVVALSAGGVSTFVAFGLLAVGEGLRADPAAFASAIVIVAVAGIFLSLLVTVTFGWLLFMAAVTVLTLWVSLGALVDRSHGAAAITVFAAIVVWSGALQYAREIGDRTPEFPEANVELKDGGTIAGLLVGRTAEVVLVADETALETGSRSVHVVPAEQVQQVDYGNDVVPEKLEKDAQEENGEEPSDVGDWWKPWTWQFLLPRAVKDSVEATGSAEDDTSSDDDKVTQPSYKRVMQDPFNPAKALAVVDAEVDGVPVRLELLGVEHSDDVAYLWLRVVNMDHQDPHTVADMLGLDQGNLNTPHLVDPATRRSYQVSQTAAGCDCASHLDTVTLDPFEQRNIEAEFVLPRSVTTVDVTVPAIGTFRDVDLE